MAQRMRDDDARALLREWLTQEETYEPLCPARGSLAHTRIEVQYLSTYDDVDDTEEYALGVRRAMEAMNALACCRGFGVDENPAFWRSVFREQGDPDASLSSSPYHAFDRAMLSRYRVLA